MMGNLGEKIQSIRESFQASYVKPAPELVDKYRQSLADNPFAMDYLQITRRLTTETIDNFKLGYDPGRNAISIPIYKRGELINIKYRLLEDEVLKKLEKDGIIITKEKGPKYLNEKNAEVWLFNEDGLSKGLGKGGVLIVEGEFDCMSVWQSGIKNVISPASGKDSYGVWLERLDTIPKVFISYDNDKPGKTAALGLAERVGTEKSFEVLYPEGIKDANEYFKSYGADEYKDLIRTARPFYKYKYAGVREVIDSIREKKENILKLKCIPFVEFEEDWLAVMSGVSNIGKTSVSMNVANELVEMGIPTLVLPIERGIRTVGKRFLQVRYNKTKDELDAMDDSDWEKVIPDVIELPLFFSMPSRDEVGDTVIKAKRLFNTKVVIIDHLDLLVRKSDPKNINTDTASAIQSFKQIAQEYSIIFILIHHIKKQEGLGTIPKKPKMEDLKGSSATYQDPEAVIMLSEPERGQLEISILKNKGTMGSRIFEFNLATGKIGEDITETAKLSPAQKALKDF